MAENFDLPNPGSSSVLQNDQGRVCHTLRPDRQVRNGPWCAHTAAHPPLLSPVPVPNPQPSGRYEKSNRLRWAWNATGGFRGGRPSGVSRQGIERARRFRTLPGNRCRNGELPRPFGVSPGSPGPPTLPTPPRPASEVVTEPGVGTEPATVGEGRPLGRGTVRRLLRGHFTNRLG